MKILSLLQHLLHKKEAFIVLNQLPSSVKIHMLPCLSQDWCCTDDFKTTAKRHCFTVCICNLLLWYFRDKNLDKEDLFYQLHMELGNGPIFRLRKAKKIFENEAFPLDTQSVSNIDQIQSALNNGQACPILLALKPWDWHWVLAVGWLEFEGDTYLLILDGWHTCADRLYKLEPGKEWLKAWTVKRK